MKIVDLFSRLQDLRINLQLVDNHLKINAPKGKLTPDLVKALKQRKGEIIEFLQSHTQKPVKYKSIDPAEKKEYYFLSSAQKRLYILYQVKTDSVSYNMPQLAALEGKLEKERLGATFKKLIERHESLRTSFLMLEGEPVQQVHSHLDIEFEIEYDDTGTRQQAAGIINNFIRPFALSHAPLLRVGLIKMEKEKHILMVDMHHIISDGTSMGILTQEIMAVYGGEELPGFRLQYKDYSEWQNQEKDGEELKQQEIYWFNQFGGELPVLNLVTDYARPIQQSFEGTRVSFEIGREVAGKLKILAMKEEATLYMVLLSIYNVLLARLCGQEDIIMGTPAAGREQEDLLKLVGMFVNTLALRNYPVGEKTFRNFLDQVKERTLADFENQEYQFEDLVDNLDLDRDASRNPLFDVMFALQNLDQVEIEISGLSLKPFEYENKTSKFDLDLSGYESGNKLYFRLEYSTRLFKQETIKRLLNYFKNIASIVGDSPDKKLAEIEFISGEEKRQILYDFNNSSREYPANKKLHELFVHQVEMTPDSIAVVGMRASCPQTGGTSLHAPYFMHQAIAYRRLNESADQLACVLIEKGVRGDTIVALMVERTIEMVIGMLAILKAGAAYLPIDPAYPQERIAYMLADTGAGLMVTNQGSFEIGRWAGERILLEECRGESRCLPPATLELYPAPAASLAYILYTSGTTGRPRGVLVQHGSAVNVVAWFAAQYRLGPGFRVLLMSDYTFDASVNQIFGTLVCGAALYIPDKELLLNIKALRQYIECNKINLLNFVPLFLKELLCNDRKLGSLETVISGAERLDNGVKDQVINLGYTLYNHYGPTEATIDALAAGCSEESVNLGKPIANARCYILDRYRKILPVGMAGELYISGTGVSRGYLNKPGLTGERFIPNPFSETVHPVTTDQSPITNQHLLYRSGDLCRWLEDGSVDFLGRIDHQVKIRGFRIEIGEIENQLLKHKEVMEAVVTARQHANGDNYLCAYFVPLGSRGAGSKELREYLSRELPDYMIPALFMPLERLPLTPGGKLDVKALPEPGVGESGREYAAPRSVTEARLAEIWSEILNIGTVGIDDNFFELGGHSLKATTLVYRIYKEFKVNIEIREVFSHPTIRELVLRINQLEEQEYVDITPTEEREYHELSYAQRRLWVLCQFEEDSTAYNMPTAVIISGPFNVQVFEQVVQDLADRHESLRTVFTLVEGRPRQRIIRDFKFKLEQLDLRRLDAEAKEASTRQMYSEFANRAFNLERGPLFGFKLLRLADEEYALMYNCHHIVNDGWSQGNIYNDMVNLYNSYVEARGNPLAPLRLQYKDYTRWHNHQIEAGSFSRSRHYWLEKFKDKPNGIDLPLDHTRKPIQTFNGGRIEFVINEEITSRLHRLCLGEDATLFMGLLTLLSLFLYKYTGQKDIMIGAPIAARKRPELNPMVGFLVNTLIYRHEVAPAQSFKENLRTIKKEALSSYEFQDYPFDLLVEQLGLDRDLSQSPLFNVMLAHNNAGTRDAGLILKGVTLSSYEHRGEFNMSKFDLIFFMTEFGDQVIITLEYNSDLFELYSIERMAGNFQALAKDTVAREDAPIHALNFLSDLEHERVIKGFNDNDHEFSMVTLQQLFERQVEKTPDKIAVVGIGQDPGARDVVFAAGGQPAVTYRRLNQKVNQLAHYLREEYQVKPNDVIGISMARSIDMIVVLLGIWKSGAAYLAVDPTYPRERVLHVLSDSGSRLLMTDKMRPDLYEGYEGTVINVLDQWDTIAQKSKKNPGIVNQPLDILYVNYTSGSTGTPNGAMLSHDCLTNLIKWQNEKTIIDCSLRVLQFTTINFCVSFQEIMGTLSSGGELHLIGDIERQDIDYLMDFLGEHRIEVIFLPFSYLNFLFNESRRWAPGFDHNLKHIVTAGEQLKITSGLKRFLDLNPALKLHNHYGSTEMHVVTSYTLDASSADKTPIPPAGKPISNVKIYILDDHFNPVPVGVWGEICVKAGSEVLGYINNEALTNKKLVLHPELSKDGIRLYRSGDIGRWMEDGNIELRGRKDFMVKMRGFRIEPGEIESRILSMPQVRECVVVVREDKSGQRYIVAYVVLSGIEPGEIRQRLIGELPQYMIPRFVVLGSLPLMPNGKVDRDRLPEPDFDMEEECAAPTNKMEVKLLEIWSELLGIDSSRIGVDANFFELGGHSLKASLMVARIYKEFDVKVSLVKVFQNPTIRELAELISRSIKTTFQDIPHLEAREYYPLSYNQQRLYILQQMQPQSPAYHMAGYIELMHEVDQVLVERVLSRIIKRHESFRTAFRTADDHPMQVVFEDVQTPFEILDLSLLEAPAREQNREAVYTRIAVEPFDLTQAPLFRTALVKLAPGHYQLMFNMHHIISDGWSLEILKLEIDKLYQGYGQGLEVDLPTLPVQYKEFALWHNRYLPAPEGKKSHQYWQDKLAVGVPVFRLPADWEIGREDTGGSGFMYMIDQDLKQELKRLAEMNNTTLFAVMFSIYILLLSGISGQEEVVCSVIAAGRDHPSLLPIIGFFVNSIIFKVQLDDLQPFEEFLQQLSRDIIESFQHQSYPLEPVFEGLGQRYPDISVSFNLVNIGDAAARETLEFFEPIHRDHKQDVKFDLEVYVTEYANGIGMLWAYKKNMFESSTVEYMIKQYLKQLGFFCRGPARPLKDYLTEESKQQIGRFKKRNGLRLKKPTI